MTGPTAPGHLQAMAAALADPARFLRRTELRWSRRGVLAVSTVAATRASGLSPDADRYETAVFGPARNPDTGTLKFVETCRVGPQRAAALRYHDRLCAELARSLAIKHKAAVVVTQVPAGPAAGTQ